MRNKYKPRALMCSRITNLNYIKILDNLSGYEALQRWDMNKIECIIKVGYWYHKQQSASPSKKLIHSINSSFVLKSRFEIKAI